MIPGSCPWVCTEYLPVGQEGVGRVVVFEIQRHMSICSIRPLHGKANIRPCLTHVTVVTILFGQNKQVVLDGVNTSIGDVAHVEDVTGPSGVVVHHRVVFEGNIPWSTLPVTTATGFIKEVWKWTVKESVSTNNDIFPQVGIGVRT